MCHTVRCREVLKKIKPLTGAGDADGEPAAKKTKLHATETVTVKRVHVTKYLASICMIKT